MLKENAENVYFQFDGFLKDFFICILKRMERFSCLFFATELSASHIIAVSVSYENRSTL